MTRPGGDGIDAIDDAAVRRLVRIAVHVRGYLVYYLATVAFGLVLLLVPLQGGGGGAESTGTESAEAAGTGPGGAAVSGVSDADRDAETFPARAGGLALDSEVPVFDAGGGGMAADTPGAEADGPEPAPPPTPTTPPVAPPSPPDPSTGPCQVRPGSPVPAVTPAREARNAQNTAEAGSGVDAPAEAEDGVETATDTAGCPDEGNDAVPPTPALPLPV